MILHHAKGNDYAFLFDCFEDLTVLNSSTNPTEIDFYQIKSKDTSGNWTVNSLVKSTKEKSSIVAKMYSNKLLFPKCTKSLIFISNARFSFKDLSDGSKSLSRSEIKGSEMDLLDKNKINTKIKDQLSLGTNPIFENYSGFLVTILSSKDLSLIHISEPTRPY